MTASALYLKTLRFAPLFALAAGALTIYSFAPFGAWPVQIVTLAFMSWLALQPTTVKRGVMLGWAFGFGWSTCGVYWLYTSMHDFGGLPPWMAATAVALMGLVLGAFPAIAMAGTAWLRQRWPGMSPTVLALLVLPALWSLSEWMRGWVFTGFPWVVSGYAHNEGALSGFAPIIGVYGIGWLAAVLAGCLALLGTQRWPLLLAAALLALGIGVQSIDWTERHGDPITVRLLQGNIAQDMKFSPNQVNATLALYHDMIVAEPADLIATPETALPLFAHELPADYLARLRNFVQRSGSHLAIGIPVSEGPRHYANSMLGFSPAPTASTEAYRYDKHHLVPFGEFIPPGARWFVDMMNIPLGDFARGALLQAPFAVKDQQILPNICYEDLFGGEIAAQIAHGYRQNAPQATILLNISNIAWFGDSLALPQHLQISQMRALETGRPMLRATNSGVTAVIDHKGAVQQQLPYFSRGVVSATVQGYRGATPYILGGNALIVSIAFLMLGIAWLLSRKKPANSPCHLKTR